MIPIWSIFTVKSHKAVYFYLRFVSLSTKGSTSRKLVLHLQAFHFLVARSTHSSPYYTGSFPLLYRWMIVLICLQAGTSNVSSMVFYPRQSHHLETARQRNERRITHSVWLVAPTVLTASVCKLFEIEGPVSIEWRVCSGGPECVLNVPKEKSRDQRRHGVWKSCTIGAKGD